MKKLLLTPILLFLFVAILWAQAPQSFKYQAVLRDNQGAEITDEQVDIRIKLVAGSAAGEAVYTEEHTIITSVQGLINLNIGDGKATLGSFNEIDWAANNYFIEVAINRKEQGFEVMGTSQLVSVPYALHAATVTDKNDADADPLNEIQDLKLTGTQLSITKSGTSIDLSSTSPWQLNEGNVFLPEGSNVGIGTDKPQGKLEVRGNIKDTPDDILFSVLNNDGDTVFAVYQGGVRVNVDNSPTKAARGGFAVASRGAAKAEAVDIFNVTGDSVRIYLNESRTKAARGGFAVASRGAAKGDVQNYMYLEPDNYFIGLESGKNITSGLYNSFLGYKTGYSNSEASNNVFLGYKSGFSNITGNSNVFIGNTTGYSNLSGRSNVIIGDSAGYKNENANFNVFIGDQSGKNNSTGENNVFVGTLSGTSNINGANNLFAGNACGFNNTSGSQNVFLGNLSGVTNTEGYSNVFIGNEAGNQNSVGTDNVYIGNGAGKMSNTYWNVFVGYQSGYNTTDNGTHNVFLGHSSGYSNTTGWSNNFIGQGAGYKNTTGTNNIFMGNDAGHESLSSSGSIYIGRNAGYNSTEYGNTIIGHTAGEGLVSGTNNLIMGVNAANQKTSGYANVILGSYANTIANNGFDNTYVGALSGGNATGSRNVFLGFSSGYNELGSNKLYIENSESSTPLIYGDFSSDSVAINGQLAVTGNISLPITTVSTGILLNEYNYTVLVNAIVTITLPPVVNSKGKVFVIKKITPTAGSVTIVGYESEPIDGATTQVISARWQKMVVQCDGTAWYIIN